MEKVNITICFTYVNLDFPAIHPIASADYAAQVPTALFHYVIVSALYPIHLTVSS
jgi:hypothetical protein